MGLRDYEGQSGCSVNCTFANNNRGISCVGSAGDNPEVINSLFHTHSLAGIYKGGSPDCTESYNAFYDPCSNSTFSMFGDLDSTDWADPNTTDANSLNGDPFNNSWSDFADRFYLNQNSPAVDHGYDPCNAGMVGYTTDPNGGADTAPVDIGYHYPLADDTDGDGLRDYQEYRLGTDYQDFDSDDDGLVDGYDGFISVNVYPEGIDSNGDGYVDSEYDAGTDPLNYDSDGDRMPDGWEFLYALDPLSDDADEDYDNDEYSNIIEFIHGSVPNDNESLPQNIILNIPLDVDSVQAAIDWSIDGDIIRLEPGIYNEQIDLKGRNITLTGSDPNDAEAISATIIDGEENGSTVTFEGTENANTQLTGLTITGGYTDGHGGGVQGNGAAAQIRKCVIHNNYSGQNGGAVHNISGTISDCVIIQNTADVAGGGLADCNAVVTNFVVTQNTASLGGGIYNTSSLSSIVSCTITANHADYGGGLYSHSGSAAVTNTILWGNTAQTQGDEVYNNAASPIFSYCDVGGCHPSFFPDTG